MRAMVWLLAGAVLTGCSPCEHPDYVWVEPASGIVDASDLVLSATWSGELPDDAAFIVESDGVRVPGKTVRHDDVLRFKPDHPFVDDREINATVKWSCGDDTERAPGQTLITRPFQSPVDDPASLAGNTYASPGDDFRVVEPSGNLGAMLEPTLRMVWLPMIHVDNVDDGSVGVSMYWADPFVPDEPQQRACSLPTHFAPGAFRNPSLETPPTDVGIVTGFGTVAVHDLVVTGRVSQDGETLGEVRAQGLFDMRDLAVELDYASAHAFCRDARQLGHPCEACPDGQKSCLPIAIDEIEATRVDTPLTGWDICNIDDRLALWNNDHLYRAERGGLLVERIDYDGNASWTFETEDPIARLVSSPERAHTPRVVLVDSTGQSHWYDLHPKTGRVLSHGYPRRGVESLVSLTLGLLSGGRGGCGAICSTLPTPGSPMGFWCLLAVAAGLVRRSS